MVLVRACPRVKCKVPQSRHVEPGRFANKATGCLVFEIVSYCIIELSDYVEIWPSNYYSEALVWNDDASI